MTQVWIKIGTQRDADSASNFSHFSQYPLDQVSLVPPSLPPHLGSRLVSCIHTCTMRACVYSCICVYTVERGHVYHKKMQRNRSITELIITRNTILIQTTRKRTSLSICSRDFSGGGGGGVCLKMMKENVLLFFNRNAFSYG